MHILLSNHLQDHPVVEVERRGRVVQTTKASTRHRITKVQSIIDNRNSGVEYLKVIFYAT